jgi:hypothetical protein
MVQRGKWADDQLFITAVGAKRKEHRFEPLLAKWDRMAEDDDGFDGGFENVQADADGFFIPVNPKAMTKRDEDKGAAERRLEADMRQQAALLHENHDLIEELKRKMRAGEAPENPVPPPRIEGQDGLL